MHELAITENILRIAEKHAIQSNAVKVTGIYLVIGNLSSIVDDSINYFWQIISDGTICEGSMLHFERIPAQIYCRNCHKTFELSGALSPCPDCGSFNLEIKSGDEFRLESIEVER